ncbi:MAG: hypothetical protein V1916_02870 [Patescibacteria group bacterium]
MINQKYEKLFAATVVIFLVMVVGVVCAALLIPKHPANQPTSTFGTLKAAEEIDWHVTPYFGNDFSFVAAFPKSWKNNVYNITPDMVHDNQPLVSYTENTGAAGENTLKVNYFFDTGDDLATWAEKRVEVLKSQKGYQPVRENVLVNGINFFQVCFLGSEQYSPMPDCYAYTQAKPYIIELRTDSASASFPAQRYIEGFIANFFFLQPGEQWSTFSNSAAGISMQYPPAKYPVIADNPGQYINFSKQFVGQFLNVQIVNGWTQGPIEYWYGEVSESGEARQVLPKKVFLGGSECYYVEFDPEYSYEGIIGARQVLCQKQGRLYVFTISTNNLAVDTDLYRMLNSVKFI